MQLEPAINALETAVETQLRVAGPETSELGTELLAALQPAIRQSLLEVISLAATEIASQLPGHRVDLRLVDGDPELVVTTETEPLPPAPEDDDEARITLRLPSYLKDLIAEAAATSGDSLNSFVIDALRNRAQTTQKTGKTRLMTTIDL
ncbi:MAG: DUF1778 domain-containing protein [Actinobacteria bacterium]|nr:DUF1778 domain-containing protein [Actinomycetota bacterium]